MTKEEFNSSVNNLKGYKISLIDLKSLSIVLCKLNK